MLYVVTVHWKSDRWIAIQKEYLQTNIDVPFKMVGFLDDEIATSFDADFDKVFRIDVKAHAKKLDIGAEYVCSVAQPRDQIMFIDGDAFPINNIAPLLEKLSQVELVAVQRAENNGDLQPHPSFCLTTVGFWTKHHPTWEQGFMWRDSNGKLVTDVGGELLKLLDEKKINWYKMNRSNKMNMAPLCFGIYDNIIYHHGLGFRKGHGGRVSLSNENLELDTSPLYIRALNKLELLNNQPILRLRNLLFPFFRRRDELREQTSAKSQAVYETIKTDKQFFKTLL